MAVIQERKTSEGKTRYRVLVRLKGYPAQSATFDRKTDARKWAQHTEAAIREGRHFKTAEAKKHTLGEMIDRYLGDVLPNRKKGQQKQKSLLEWWKEALGPYALAEVTPALISECRDQLLNGTTYRGTQRSPATVVRYMAALSVVFNLAVNEWEWLEVSPMARVKKPKEPRGRVRFLDQEERVRLLDACQNSRSRLLYPIVVLAISSGMR